MPGLSRDDLSRFYAMSKSGADHVVVEDKFVAHGLAALEGLQAATAAPGAPAAAAMGAEEADRFGMQLLGALRVVASGNLDAILLGLKTASTLTDSNARDVHKGQPYDSVHFCARVGCYDGVLRHVREREENLNVADEYGRNALMYAATNGHVRLSLRLLDLGGHVTNATIDECPSLLVRQHLEADDYADNRAQGAANRQLVQGPPRIRRLMPRAASPSPADLRRGLATDGSFRPDGSEAVGARVAVQPGAASAPLPACAARG